jgi:hypothetical protein
MVGEIRDLETAQIAVQAALTGHLILSTLHTNDAASGITRLLDMGVEDYLLTSTVNGIVAQRLVRKLCLVCRQAYEALPAFTQRFAAGIDRPVTLYRAVGCAECGGSGFHGRTTILEILPITDDDPPADPGACAFRRDPAHGRGPGHAHDARARRRQGARRHHHDRGGAERRARCLKRSPLSATGR